MSRSCTLCFPEYHMQTRGRENALTSSLHTIKRYALNTKADVGSFYSVYTDNVLADWPLDKSILVKKQVQGNLSCELFKVDGQDRGNLLKVIKIDDPLRVSVALGMTKVTEGISTLYSYEPPADRTIRLISYCRIDQEEYLPDNIELLRKVLPDSLRDEDITHVITSVKRGIDFVIVFELPSNVNEDRIDSVLEQLRVYFINPNVNFLSEEDQQIINSLRFILFTSIADIHSFTKNENFSLICQQIHGYIDENLGVVPLSYTLHRVNCIYYDKLHNETNCYNFAAWRLDDKFLSLSNRLRKIERLFNETIKLQLLPFFRTRVELSDTELCRLRNVFIQTQQTLSVEIQKYRQKRYNGSEFYKVFDSIDFATFDTQLEALQTTIDELINKISFITKLKADFRMDYLNVADLEGPNDNQESIEQKLPQHNQTHSRCYFIGTSQSVESTLDHLKRLYHELQQTEMQSEIVFADFFYCKSKPNSMKILRPQSLHTPINRSIIEPVQPEEINILLIGESGVGKSTFINAFVNYLAFPKFEDAINGRPVVLIPVSFLITVGDQFDEKMIQFGQFDGNENFNSEGQSVTQCCKSYVFSIENNIKLRIIDTPGFGDTRGVKQDDKNIDHILSYINNLSHLNAVCFLVKPNTARLHAMFRSCFMQLVQFLGPHARENIIFCFTNTRSTFYTPGDTAKPLKSMLNELPTEHQPLFVKKNIFCFDSEAFRYLAIVQNGQQLSCNEQEVMDFEKSWQTSMTESVRLLNLLKSCPKFLTSELRSIKHAQMMVTLLIQPILETIRNSLRNIVLCQADPKQRIIELKARSISLPAWLCTNCSCKVISMDSISIPTHPIRYQPLSDKCEKCLDASSQYLPVFYEVDYQYGNIRGEAFLEEIGNVKKQLLWAIVLLSRFLLPTTSKSENLFSLWFDLFISQEKCLESFSTNNKKLYDQLSSERNNYLNHLQGITDDDELVQLDAVYRCLDEILKYPSIKEQMHAIKESQMKTIRNNECDVSSQYP